jgi:hypothetical protein
VVNLSPNEMAFRISKSIGTFSGEVREPVSGQMRAFGGVLLQKQNAGYGTMVGPALSSRVMLSAP